MLYAEETLGIMRYETLEALYGVCKASLDASIHRCATGSDHTNMWCGRLVRVLAEIERRNAQLTLL